MFPQQIICLDPSMLANAQTCSELLSIPIHEKAHLNHYLEFKNNFIYAVSSDKKQCIRFTHDFEQASITRRLQTQNQHLLKAFKDKRKPINSVIDATAGWCRDSFILAQNGYQVTAIEQADLVFFLSSHSIKRYKQAHPIPLNLIHNNALNYIKTLEHPIDAIYLDPMFPSTKKQQAKNKKEIQLLQAVTQNVKITELFQLALHKASQRVVVKRPLQSAFLADKKPDFQYKGKTVRFDVYQSFCS